MIQLKDSGVSFDAEAHRYFLNGIELNGITGLLHKQVFPDMYHDIPKWVLDRAAERGTMVHESIELLDAGFTPAESTPELDSYKRIKADNGLKTIANEYIVTDSKHFASGIDLVLGDKDGNIVIADIGKVIEVSPDSIRLNGTVPAGRVFVDGYGVGDVGAVVLRDRKHLAQDGMIVVVASVSVQDGGLVSGPDIITRGFVYVKESEGLMEELKAVVLESMEKSQRSNGRDWSAVKGDVKNDLSNYLFKKTKRNPMILPVIMEV